MSSGLSAFQREVLEAFFARTRAFYLTGGGALAGFHLAHRNTEDLDLFTSSAELDEGDRVLEEVASSLRATLERVQTHPTFRRRLLRRGSEGVLVDLAQQRGSPSEPPKELRGAVVLDGPRQILANKLCAVLSRAELRDVVDLMALEKAGWRIEDGLTLALEQDAGATPAQLAWVLSEIRIGDDARIPGGASPDGVRTYLKDLVNRLARLAAPTSS